MARKTKFTTSIIKKKLRLKPRARKGQKNKKNYNCFKMIYTLTLFNWMRNTKTDTLINGPNLKSDTQFKEKTKPYEFNRNTQIFLASLP